MTSDNKKEIPLWLVSVWVSIGILILMVVWPMISNSIKEASIKPLKQVTHERVADMEQYVYDKVGPNIYFQEPEINEEEHTVVLKLIQNEGDMDYSRFNLARIAINDYLEQDPDYFLNDEYYIDLQYLERNKIPGDYVDSLISHSTNHFQFDGYYISASSDGNIHINDMYEGVYTLYCMDYYTVEYAYGDASITTIDDLSYTPSYEVIMEILSNVPNLRYLCIGPRDDYNDCEDIMNYLRETGSDVTILIEAH